MTGEIIKYYRGISDITETNEDPDHVVMQVALKEMHGNTNLLPEHFVIHSTSWRFERGGIVLTYIVYSESFGFMNKPMKTLKLSDLEIAVGESIKKPRPAIIEEINVISHAIRHLSFLVQHDSEEKYAKAIDKESTALLKQVYTSLAGRV